MQANRSGNPNTDDSWIVLAGGVLTILFGAVPATIVCVVPAFFFGLGIYGIFTENVIDEGISFSVVAFMTYCFGAIYGTISLWLVPFLGSRWFVVVGLIAGLLAISPFTYGYLFDPWLYDDDDRWFAWSAILPFFTAICWLAAFGIGKYKSRARGQYKSGRSR